LLLCSTCLVSVLANVLFLYIFFFVALDKQTFHVLGADVPDDYSRVSPQVWKSSVGLSGFDDEEEEDNENGSSSAFLLFPSPAFQNELDDLLRGLATVFPNSTTFGAIASTVSSLSRARLFRYDASEGDSGIQTLADGCVGVAMSGDIRVETMIAQGAKPVGGVYQIVKGQDSTIQAIALDEVATEQVQAEQDDDDQDDDDDEEAEEDDNDTPKTDKQAMTAKLQAAYAKARIPKPVLAEANFLMKTLSDDDQAFMRKALLVGIERGGSVGRTPSELARLAEGKGHRFSVHQVASASMKDGSVTLSLGSVQLAPRTRMRFFVRESAFAKREVEALWMGYKRRTLSKALVKKKGPSAPPFVPTGCFLFPTLDRGSRFFLGKSGYESNAASQYMPTVPCISGFFCNGVIGKLEGDDGVGVVTDNAAQVHGSASGYILFGSSE
jgi:small ligand-binding sensory domain FIST